MYTRQTRAHMTCMDKQSNDKPETTNILMEPRGQHMFNKMQVNLFCQSVFQPTHIGGITSEILQDLIFCRFAGK